MVIQIDQIIVLMTMLIYLHQLILRQVSSDKEYTNIKKVEAIIAEFRATLNFKYPVAKDFDNVYEYLGRRLLEANLHKDKEILEEVLSHLRVMRETWTEVMKQSK